MSGQLHFAIDACGVERRVGRGRVRTRQRLRVGRFHEFKKGTGKIGFLEDPEVALRARVMLLLALHALEEPFSPSRRDERPLHAEGSRHYRQATPASGKLSRPCLTKARNLSASDPSTMR